MVFNWVKENIGVFGGDFLNVMLFGESVGVVFIFVFFGVLLV